ncbi:DEAD/DEAH box helicase [[Eubacterium] cellulosolvens]
MTEVFRILQRPVRLQINRQGIIEASEIQKLAIQPILQKKNVLLIAPTGTGKTLAAILPIFDLYLSAKKTDSVDGISILYITPLRALNRDILRRLIEIGKELGLDVQVRHGDTPTSTRTKQAKKPPDMMITTPETLQAILPGKRMKEHLKHVKWLVVDEIHELATDKRGVQLSVAIERLRRLVGHEFQRIGLSATIGETEKIAKFLSGSRNQAEVIKSSELRSLDVKIEKIKIGKTDYDIAKDLGISSANISRVRRICELVTEPRSTLIFTNTREHAEALGSQINAINCRNPVKVHHGSLSREIREEVEIEFQKSVIKAVICTSSLELGIDVGTVDLVIHYMSPRQATRLIQRIGRSGHQIKSIPRGRIITTWADDILESMVLIDRANKGQLERVKIHENALDVLAHQIVGLILDTKTITVDEAYDTIRRAYPFRNIEPEVFYDVIKQLQQQRIIRLRDEILSGKYLNTYRYYYENLSVIPDVKKYTVFNFSLKRRIGTLDQEFVAKRCQSGTEFIMHGNTWRVISVDDEKMTVEVEAAASSLNAIPSWEGEIIPVEYDVALEVGKLRQEILQNSQSIFRYENQELDKVKETIERHSRDYPLPSHEKIVIERFENCIIIHACFGNLVNEALSLVISALLQAKYGINILTHTDSYRIAIITPIKMDPKKIATEIKNLKEEEIPTIIKNAIEYTETFAWRHWHVAKRFGAVEAKADYKLKRGKLLVNVFRNTPINEEAKREIYLEKIDIGNTVKLIKKILMSEIEIIVVDQKGTSCSPFSLPIVDKVVPHNLLRPALPSQPLANIVKERLMATSVKLICIFNADWESVRDVKTLPDVIRCPKCNSTLISVGYHGDQEILQIIKKKKKHLKLSTEEKIRWNRAWKSASLVQTAGKRAILTMAARGVGPVIASRILRKPIRNEAEFYSEILKAEREYQRTRLFWD